MYKYNFGMRNGTLKVTADAAGNVAWIHQGVYLLIVVNETVEVSAKVDAVVAAGESTPLAVGTQVGIRIEDKQQWSFRSSGGTGVVWFVRLE